MAWIPTEELPIRLAHRVKELDGLPHNLSRMPSIEKVKKWYAESFEVCIISILLLLLPSCSSPSRANGMTTLKPGTRKFPPT